MIKAYLIPWQGPLRPVSLKVRTDTVQMPVPRVGGFDHEELRLMELEYPKGSWQVHNFYVNPKLNPDIVATKIAMFFGV